MSVSKLFKPTEEVHDKVMNNADHPLNFNNLFGKKPNDKKEKDALDKVIDQLTKTGMGKRIYSTIQHFDLDDAIENGLVKGNDDPEENDYIPAKNNISLQYGKENGKVEGVIDHRVASSYILDIATCAAIMNSDGVPLSEGSIFDLNNLLALDLPTFDSYKEGVKDTLESTRALKLMGYACGGSNDNEVMRTSAKYVSKLLRSDTDLGSVSDFLEDKIGVDDNRFDFVIPSGKGSGVRPVPVDGDKVQRVVFQLANEYEGEDKIIDTLREDDAGKIYVLSHMIDDNDEFFNKISDKDYRENFEVESLMKVGTALNRYNVMHTKEDMLNMSFLDPDFEFYGSNHAGIDQKLVSRLENKDEFDTLVNYGLAVNAEDGDLGRYVGMTRQQKINEFGRNLANVDTSFMKRYMEASKEFLDSMMNGDKEPGSAVRDFRKSILGDEYDSTVDDSCTHEDAKNFTHKIAEKYGRITTVLFEEGCPRLDYRNPENPDLFFFRNSYGRN